MMSTLRSRHHLLLGSTLLSVVSAVTLRCRNVPIVPGLTALGVLSADMVSGPLLHSKALCLPL
jgi:hypothetical protein